MRVIRIVEHPAYARAGDWWHGLSRRERILVGTLGVLLALAILVFGIVKPLQASRAASLADIRTHETLMARIRAAPALGPPAGPPPRTGAPADILQQSAQSFALQPQLEATPNGIRATLPDVGYDGVVNWMADVARTSSLRATRVDVRRLSTPGRVSAQVEYAP
ncbi:type II secretion system protein GspM [Sphingomonas sp.]|uniref:type II secretion system protein GspM n=1 Tax=Sphingomonas sp. TaxID=28214 RepID=UPI002DD642E5|nr:type II secretion system protein GspM [Sphingomonas sp.]